MLNLQIIKDTAQPDDVEKHDFSGGHDMIMFLKKRFGSSFPDNARLYEGEISLANEITPKAPTLKDDIDRLLNLNGTVIMVFEAQFGGLFFSIILPLVAGIAELLLRDKTPTTQNNRSGSPNNGLSTRVNQVRLNERIPDIYGEIRATPDMISNPYTRYIDHRQVEFTYLCVGRGYFNILDVREDETDIAEITGSRVAVYDPGTSPNTGDAPSFSVGTPIEERIWATREITGVTSQVLRPPNADRFNADGNVAFTFPDQIELVRQEDADNSNDDWTTYFAPDDELIVTNATGERNGVSFNLNGTYNVLSVESDAITLSNPNLVNSDWGASVLGAIPDQTTQVLSPVLETNSDKWVGPFTIRRAYRVFSNFVAQNGLFRERSTDDGVRQSQVDVELELGVTPVDDQDNEIGPEEFYRTTIEGSATIQSLRASSIDALTINQFRNADGDPIDDGINRAKVRARRVSETDLDFNGNLVDEVIWESAYSAELIGPRDFRDVTTVHSMVAATAGSLSIQERRLNMLVQRRIRTINPGGNISTNMIFSNSVEDIIAEMAIDRLLGGLTTDDIDGDQLLEEIQRINEYFGTNKMTQFNGTFDNSDLSFEEMVETVGNAISGTFYRQGSKIRLAIESKDAISKILFNSANKIPASETRAVTFGFSENNDGVELSYIDPEEDTQEVFRVPENGAAVNPRVVEGIGIRSKLQARLLAYRLFNKLVYQHEAVDFEATAEAGLLVVGNVITVADNTRDDKSEGEIRSQNGLNIELSVPVDLDPSSTYDCLIQLPTGAVESIEVATQVNPTVIGLSRLPMVELSLCLENYARSTFWIVKRTSSRDSQFLVTERENTTAFTSRVGCVNWSENYYQNDFDFKNGIVDENGDLI